jgi:hypothetical protein
LPFKNSLLFMYLAVHQNSAARGRGRGAKAGPMCRGEKGREKRAGRIERGGGGRRCVKTQGNPGGRAGGEAESAPNHLAWGDSGGRRDEEGHRGAAQGGRQGFCVRGFFTRHLRTHCAAVAPSVNGSRGGMVPGSGSECASEWRCVLGSGLWKEAGCGSAPARSSFPLGGKLCVCDFFMSACALSERPDGPSGGV